MIYLYIKLTLLAYLFIPCTEVSSYDLSSKSLSDQSNVQDSLSENDENSILDNNIILSQQGSIAEEIADNKDYTNLLLLEKEKKLEVNKKPDYCFLPNFVGRCRAAFKRWYYDGDADECLEFIYGGCDGNQNNFNSKFDCDKVCRSNNINPLRQVYNDPKSQIELQKLAHDIEISEKSNLRIKLEQQLTVENLIMVFFITTIGILLIAIFQKLRNISSKKSKTYYPIESANMLISSNSSDNENILPVKSKTSTTKTFKKGRKYNKT